MFNKKTVPNTQRYLDIMNQWLILKQKGIKLENYLMKNGYKNVAIYGMGIYGRHLIREFVDSTQVKLMYGIDKREMDKYEGVDIRKLKEVQDYPDVVINTIFYDDSVKRDLEKTLKCDVVSFEELIFESYDL